MFVQAQESLEPHPHFARRSVWRLNVAVYSKFIPDLPISRMPLELSRYYSLKSDPQLVVSCLFVLRERLSEGSGLGSATFLS